MDIILIAAVDNNLVIGKNNSLPWHLSDDLKFFKETTKNHHVVVGRKTYESFGSKPLPNRTNIVLTSQFEQMEAGDHNLIYSPSLKDAIYHGLGMSETEFFICGGRGVYEDGLHHANYMYLTRVHAQLEGDTKFPIDPNESYGWSLIRQSETYPDNEKNDYPFHIEKWQKI